MIIKVELTLSFQTDSAYPIYFEIKNSILNSICYLKTFFEVSSKIPYDFFWK